MRHELLLKMRTQQTLIGLVNSPEWEGGETKISICIMQIDTMRPTHPPTKEYSIGCRQFNTNVNLMRDYSQAHIPFKFNLGLIIMEIKNIRN